MKNLDKNPTEAVILANGEYPTHSVPVNILRNASYVACCDGAANEYLSRGYIPDAIIGDGDSISPAYKSNTPTSSIPLKNKKAMTRQRP